MITSPKFTVIPRLIHQLKAGFEGVGAKQVSFYGALPSPAHAYEVVEDGFSIRNSRDNTTSNYFYGKVLGKDRAEADSVCDRLNKHQKECIAHSKRARELAVAK